MRRTSTVMLSALLMLRRVSVAFRYAIREEDFLTVFGAGVTLTIVGTLSYTFGADWNVVEDGWLKIFTVFYQLIGIGILVEILS